MATRKKRTLPQPVPPAPAVPPPAETPRPIAVVDMGASAIRLVVAEVPAGQPLRILEEVSRGVLLGKDTFTHGRLGSPTIEATLKALEGFRRLMDTYGVLRYRAVATSAVREASNSDAFLDRVRLRTGLDVEVIDGSEENRLTYIAVREQLRDHPARDLGDALLVEVGGGSADISFLRKGQPIQSGTYPLGSIRMRQSLASWQGSHEQGARLLVRHIHNVVDDIRREMPLREAAHFIAVGADVRFAAARILGDEAPKEGVPVVTREAFIAFCDEIIAFDLDQILERYQLSQSEAETLVPALLAYRELLLETVAEQVTVPEASLRLGLLLDLAREGDGQGIEDLRRQVLASATAVGEKYRFDAPTPARCPRSRCACSTSCGPSTGFPIAIACCWKWRRCSTTSATTSTSAATTSTPGTCCRRPTSSASPRTTWRWSATWPATTAGPFPRRATCPTWPSTATRASTSTSSPRSCAWPTPSTPTTCRR